MSGDARGDLTTVVDMYRAIWRVSGRQQIVLIGLSLAVAALAAAPLRFQQLVVNSLVQLDGVDRLAWLSAGFLAVVLASAALKFALNFRISIVGERVVRLMRERLYVNAVTDTAAGAAGVPKRGTLVSMLSAESEAIGTFAGAAIASPLLQVGTLVSVIAFILANQPRLGVLVLGVVLPQAVIVAALQRRINRRVRERVQLLRDVSGRISEGDLRQVEADVLADFDAVYATRRKVFFLKLSSKFALGVLSAIGVAGILFLGGWLVLQGRSDVGTVVASLTGLTRIEGPWRGLIAFYRSASVVRVKYGMIVGAVAPRRADATPRAVAPVAAER